MTLNSKLEIISSAHRDLNSVIIFVWISRLQDNVIIRKVELQLEGLDLDKAVNPVIREFFEHGDTGEVLVSRVSVPIIFSFSCFRYTVRAYLN